MIEKSLNKLKKDIVYAAYTSAEGHIPSAFSILDLIWVLYNEVISINENNFSDLNNDRFILSKGHASLALYAVLAYKGFLPKEELATFCKYNSRLGGHPDCTKIPIIEASTGSLGHGFPMAVGLALGSKIQAINNKIYCLIGDGECNEGTVWEAALLAAHHNLSNLCCIVDFNHSTDRALKLGNLSEKFKSFGWFVINISGHDHDAIKNALDSFSKTQPLVIIAETIKGNGVERMMGQPAWHHRSPNKIELEEIIEELT
jgi:transketolase